MQNVNSRKGRPWVYFRILPLHKGLNFIRDLLILQIYLLALPPYPEHSSGEGNGLRVHGLRPKGKSADSSITVILPLLGSRPAQGHSLMATWRLLLRVVIFPFFNPLFSSSILVPWMLLIFVYLLTPLIALLFPRLLSFLTLWYWH